MTFGTAEKLCLIYTKEPTRRYVVLDHDLTPSFTNDLDQAALFATAHVKEWIGLLVWHALINNENQVQSVPLTDAMKMTLPVEGKENEV
jgi:hypothetical protein